MFEELDDIVNNFFGDSYDKDYMIDVSKIDWQPPKGVNKNGSDGVSDDNNDINVNN